MKRFKNEAALKEVLELHRKHSFGIFEGRPLNLIGYDLTQLEFLFSFRLDACGIRLNEEDPSGFNPHINFWIYNPENIIFHEDPEVSRTILNMLMEE